MKHLLITLLTCSLSLAPCLSYDLATAYGMREAAQHSIDLANGKSIDREFMDDAVLPSVFLFSGYVLSTYDWWYANQSVIHPKEFQRCYSPVKSSELTNIAAKYIIKHPEKGDSLAILVLFDAFNEYHGCKFKKEGKSY